MSIQYLERSISFLSAQIPETEASVEIKRFSAGQKEALGKQGFVIYGLTGQSIKTLRDRGYEFHSWLRERDGGHNFPTWIGKRDGGHNFPIKIDEGDFSDFEALVSMCSEVAINPANFFLPKSGYKKFSDQEKMVEEFSQELGEEVPGVKAIIGKAPDYAELAFQHLDGTGCYLFGMDNYTRTKTPTGSPRSVIIGRRFGTDGDLDIDDWYDRIAASNVLAAPLVVPV